MTPTKAEWEAAQLEEQIRIAQRNTARDILQKFLQRIHDDHCGFLREDDVAELAKLDRLHQLLVRCGCGRFTCAAQDVKHFIDLIEKASTEYVRDVSLLSTDPFYQTIKKPEHRSPFPSHCYQGDFESPSDADPGL